MAQYDTGLGWSAKDDWLMFNTSNICKMTKVVGCYKLPYCPTDNDVVAEGALWCKQRFSFTRATYIASRTENVDVYAFIYPASSGIGSTIQVFCAQQGAHIRYVRYNETAGRIENSYSIYTNIVFTEIPGYYYQVASSGSADLSYGPIDYYNSVQDAVSAISISSYQISKANQGAAVVAIAKWKTASGAIITSPILISNDSSFSDMTPNITDAPFAKLRIKNDGMIFYMGFYQNTQYAVEPESLINVYDISGPNDPYADLEEVFALLARSFNSNIVVLETVDPFEDFGNTGEDAGEINPDPQDDDVDFDDLPTKSFATAGFCRIFNPDVSDLNALASYMWTDQTFLQTVINHLKQILENPIEAIISLSMVPVQPPRGSTKVPVNVMFVNTGVSMYPVTNQFVEVDCGTLSLEECYGGALDYNPYTRVQVYLPYIGIVQLDTDEVMAKTLHLKYNIDVVTGICCAEIKANNKLLYSFSGHCAVSQPITSADFSSYLNAAVAAAKVAVGVATGMASTTAGAAAAELPPAVPSKGQTSSALVPLQSSGAIGPHLGSPAMSSSRGLLDFSDIPEPESGGGVNWGELAKPGNVNTVASAMGGKMVVQHSGGFSGNSGYLAKRRPYLIIIRPRIANPKNYAQHFGRTSMEYLNLGSCTGYTKVQSVHLTGFDATNPELSEISSLLKGGVLM